jgi:hypothetical protein
LPSWTRRILFALIVVAVAAISILCLVRFRAKNLIPANQPWTVRGSFARNGEYFKTKFDLGISDRDKQRVDFWGSWLGSDASVGELHSPVFVAPTMLECFLAGYPGRSGLAVYLERQSDHQRFPLQIEGNSFPGEIWRPFHWRVPAGFRGQAVELVAIDSSTEYGGWLGVSTPRRFSYLALLHQQLPGNLMLMARGLLLLAVFLFPGFAVARLMIIRWPSLLPHALMVIVSAAGALGYVAFYVFFFSVPAGQVFSLLVGLAALLSLRRSGLRPIAKQVAEPVVLAAATMLCYVCFAFLFVSTAAAGASHINGRFYSVTLPGDNIIPLIFAEKIYNHEPLRPFCCGDWLSSDRPPLETGIFLLQRAAPWITSVDRDYELLGTGLQCLWIGGVWSVLVSLGTSLVQIRRALVFLIFCGAVFFNSIYTWPKFLAATFILFALSILIRVLRQQRVPARAEAILASLCLGLALVSHPTSIYSLFTLPLLFVRFRHLFPWRKVAPPLAITVAVVLAFVLPWMAYQKFVDPPGDRLIKWHLAGHPEPDSLTAWQELRKAYGSHTAGQILALRWGNMRYLAGDQIRFADSQDARKDQREYVLQALGVLNAGFFALIVFAARRKQPAIPFAGWIIGAVLLNLLIWCCLEFGPRMTPLVHSSYADFLLLSIGLLGFVLALPRALILSLFALQLANFFAIWVWSPPYWFASWGGPFEMVVLQMPLLFFGGVLAVVLIAHLGFSDPAQAAA